MKYINLTISSCICLVVLGLSSCENEHHVATNGKEQPSGGVRSTTIDLSPKPTESPQQPLNVEDQIKKAVGAEWKSLLQEAVSQENVEERRIRILQIITEIVKRDPESFTYLMESLPMGNERIERIGDLIAMSGGRPRLAASVLEAIVKKQGNLDEEERFKLQASLSHSLMGATESHLESVLEHVPEIFKPLVASRLAKLHGENGNVSAFTQLLSSGTQTEVYRVEVLRPFLNEYARKSSDDAVDFVSEFKFKQDAEKSVAIKTMLEGIFSVNRKEALLQAIEWDSPEGISERWANKSIEEFSSNLASLPESPQRDRAVEVLLKKLKRTETAERKQWLNFIPNDETKERIARELEIPL